MFRSMLLRSADAGNRSARLGLIKELRARTDAPLSDCGKAIDASNNNIDEAIKWLQKNGAAKAVKKQGRATEYGVACACIVDGKGGAIIQLGSETDFAARNDKFIGCADEIRKDLVDILSSSSSIIGSGKPEDNEALLKELTERSKDKLASLISVVGENVAVRRVMQLPLIGCNDESFIGHPNLVLGQYVHNAPQRQFPLIGSIVGVTALSPIDPTKVSQTFSVTDANDIAQHQVANLGDNGSLQSQSFLGSDETAGKWMKRHEFRVRSTIVFKSGDLEPVFKVPTYGPPQQHQQQEKKE